MNDLGQVVTTDNAEFFIDAVEVIRHCGGRYIHISRNLFKGQAVADFMGDGFVLSE